MPSPQTDACVELIDVMGSDLTVVNAAAKEHEIFEEPNDTRLISYLASHNHWTPFSHPTIQFRITVPIFVARQWVKSMVGTRRTPIEAEQFSAVNETSRRYVGDGPEFYRIDQYRAKPVKYVKQGSGGTLDQETNERCINMALSVEQNATACYREMLALGVAPEQARSILPQSMLTQWYETASLAYWARFCGLRLGEHAQQEIKDYAVVISGIMGELFPVSWPVLMAQGEA